MALSCSLRTFAQCTGETHWLNYLERNFPVLTFSEQGERCSQITQGDFNFDGEMDTAAVLTEANPTRTYQDGDPWYRTYIAVLLSVEVPYNDYQLVFVRTVSNAPRRYSVSSVETDLGHDLVVEARNYSYTRYSWSEIGFVSIEHTAD